MDRWAQVYGSARRGELSIIAAATSHHRFTWIHPFLDGNGRVARLHTHLLFHAMGLSKGLWSPLRGFARTEQRYKALLQAADDGLGFGLWEVAFCDSAACLAALLSQSVA